ncbi:MAG: C2H2-type zinc finger protein [Nitrososphaerota archaeon]|nr:C2H2-type zinc finger protein [Candidatus Calditenuis fumarioli]
MTTVSERFAKDNYAGAVLAVLRMRYRCRSCGATFASREALRAHIRSKHPVSYYAPRIGYVSALVLVALVGGYLVLAREPPAQAVGAPISGIECWSMEQVAYHVHAKLEVYVRGERRTVPANIGIIPNRCMYWLHTHDATGWIHVEAPREIRPTLGQFFDIWGQPLSRERVLDVDLVSSGLGMRVYVDGKPYDGDPREIELIDMREIVIDVGPPFAISG